MPMSTTIVAVIINIFATVLPWLGVSVGTDELTTTVTVIVTVVTGVWIWYKRVQRGDVDAFGRKK